MTCGDKGLGELSLVPPFVACSITTPSTNERTALSLRFGPAIQSLLLTGTMALSWHVFTGQCGKDTSKDPCLFAFASTHVRQG